MFVTNLINIITISIDFNRFDSLKFHLRTSRGHFNGVHISQFENHYMKGLLGIYLMQCVWVGVFVESVLCIKLKQTLCSGVKQKIKLLYLLI